MIYKQRIIAATVYFLVLPSIIRGAPCTICIDGSPMSKPEKIIVIPVNQEGEGSQFDCATLESFIPFFVPDEASNDCKLVHSLSTICGCPRQADSCDLCPTGESALNPATLVPDFSTIFSGATPTCDMVEAYLHSVPNADELCLYSRQGTSKTCGCETLMPTDAAYNATSTMVGGSEFNVDDDKGTGMGNGGGQASSVDFGAFSGRLFGGSKKDTGDRVGRSAAILSIVGALLVIQDNVRRRRLGNLYNQIVISMAFFDILFSIASAFLSMPMPTDDMYQMRGEKGTHASCKVQGWALQWAGMTSVFLNVSLSTYYVLVIVYGYRESKLRRVRNWILGAPVVTGALFGFASIPFVAPGAYGCHVIPPLSYLSHAANERMGIPQSWAPFLILYIIPGYLSIAYTTGALVYVYWKVCKVEHRGNRWRWQTDSHSDSAMRRRLGGGHRLQRFWRARNNTTATRLQLLRKQVLIQSAFYLWALYMTWLVYLSVFLNLEKLLTESRYYILWSCFLFLVPLQGFLNCCVYFRPRLSNYGKQLKTSLLKRKNRTNSSGPASNLNQIMLHSTLQADLVVLNEPVQQDDRILAGLCDSEEGVDTSLDTFTTTPAGLAIPMVDPVES